MQVQATAVKSVFPAVGKPDRPVAGTAADPARHLRTMRVRYRPQDYALRSGDQAAYAFEPASRRSRPLLASQAMTAAEHARRERALIAAVQVASRGRTAVEKIRIATILLAELKRHGLVLPPLP